MKKINIIIVDSGVRTNHPKLKNKVLSGFSMVNGMRVDGFEDTYGHGTAIYAIISKCENIANITNIKLTDLEHNVDEEELINVLEYIYEYMTVDIINLSLGITLCTDYHKLKKVCKKITDKGVIIVSAFDNAGAISYPAAFDNVIGVAGNNSCNKTTEFEYINSSVLNVCAKGSIQRLFWYKPDYIMLGGNSFACAHVTLQIASFMFEGVIGIDNIKKAIKEIAISKKDISDKTSNIIKINIDKAVLFPFNKEMHSLVRFNDMVNFNIVDVYDTKYSAVIGTTTDYLLKDNVKSFKIKNIKNIEWDTFDTIILGHLDELSNLSSQIDLKSEIVKAALLHKKQIYSFDDISEFITNKDKKNIYFPKVTESDLPPDYFGKLYRISKPVLGIFGTSSRQGKFTLQMKLRKKFLEDGYKVGQIGSEPSSLLYGMDYVYPMGYNSSVYIKENDVVCYLNFLMNKLCLNNSDIIIVGSQSGTITFDVGNIAQFNLSQYSFLMGTQPDAVILCVNPFDDLSHIKRTIRFIEACNDCKVIAIVVFPMDLKNDWSGIYSSKIKLSDDKFTSIKSKIESEFQVPIFNLGYDISQLYEIVIDYFTE